MNYEKRICCFIDILGFRQHIEETVDELGKDKIEKIEKIKYILDLSKKMTDDSGFSKSKIVTYFSDSIVISYDYTEPSQLYHTLIDLLYVSFELANQGYLARGGVTIGKLIHTNELIFGPAMVKAYDLESKEAIYPRIIVEKEVVENGIKFKVDNHSANDELEYIFDIITEDSDGNYYIDYISKSSSEFNDPEYDLYGYLDRLKNFFDDFQDLDDKVQKKLLWLKEKINNEIKQK
jgi:hypothetical protein